MTQMSTVRQISVAVFFVALFLFAPFFFTSAAFANIEEDVGRVFELHAKLKPGSSPDSLNELLGPPAQSGPAGAGTEDVMRFMWLHGEMGVEAYCIRDVAWKISITLLLRSEKDVLRAMDAFTRRGRSVYGSMPRFDYTTGEYYWVGNDGRFGFSKYNATTVRSSRTQAP